MDQIILESRKSFDALTKSGWSPLQLVLVVSGTVILLQLLQQVVAVIRDPLRDVPGPWQARWTNAWYMIQNWGQRSEKATLALHKKFGPVVRIAPRTYSIDDPTAARIIYGVGSTPFEKSDWYTTQMAPGQVTLFTDRKNAHAAQTKRKFGSTYSASDLMQYEPFVDNCTEILLQQLEERSASGKAIDLAEWLQYYAFDVIGEITFSYRFVVLEKGSDQNGLLDAIHNLFQSNGEKFIISFVGKHVLDYKSALEDKREGPLDFVQRWLNVQESDPDKMSMREIFIGAGQNIGAGSDTTSATFSAIFYYLCQNPELMKKLRLELAEAKEKGELSNLAKYQEAAKLPYLQAVIKEGMRLHPVAAFPIPRVIPKGGATLVGRHFREGDVIGINPYVSHRNKTVFGEDPDSFRPERWLVAKDQSREMERYSMAWGMGSRSCLGKHIAMLEMLKIVPTLIQKFDMQLEEPNAPLNTVNVMLNMVADLRCYVTPLKD